MNKLVKIFLASFLTLSTALATFNDVNNTTDYQPAINSMVELGVIDGYPDGSFKPDKCVNRVEFLKMLFLANQTKQYSYNDTFNERMAPSFPDVPEGQWYSPYLFTALMRNVVQGYPDGLFRPENCVNRAEAIKMAILEFNNNNIPSYQKNAGGYSDIDEGQWYAQFMLPALYNNLVGTSHAQTTSVSSANYFPEGLMSRAEVAEMLFRMKTVKDKNLSIYSASAAANEIVFDSCGSFSKYSSQSWFPSLQSSLQNQFQQTLDLNSKEGCLSLDGNLFIFISNADTSGCGKIKSYDKRSGIILTPNQNHCAREFQKRVGDYVNFTGNAVQEEKCITYSGKYYFNENRVEVGSSLVQCSTQI